MEAVQNGLQFKCIIKNYIKQYNPTEKLFCVFYFCNAPRIPPSSTFASSITKLAQVFIQPCGFGGECCKGPDSHDNKWHRNV